VRQKKIFERLQGQHQICSSWRSDRIYHSTHSKISSCTMQLFIQLIF